MIKLAIKHNKINIKILILREEKVSLSFLVNLRNKKYNQIIFKKVYLWIYSVYKHIDISIL